MPPVDPQEALAIMAGMHSQIPVDKLRFGPGEWEMLGVEGQEAAQAIASGTVSSLSTRTLRRVAQRATAAGDAMSPLVQVASHPQFLAALQAKIGVAGAKNKIGNAAARLIGSLNAKKAESDAAARALVPGGPEASMAEGGITEGLQAAAGEAGAIPTLSRTFRTAQKASLLGKVDNPLAAVATSKGWKRYMALNAAKIEGGIGPEAGIIAKGLGKGSAGVLKMLGRMGRLNTAGLAVSLAPFAADFAGGIASDVKRKFTGSGVGEPSYEEQLQAQQGLAAMAMESDLRQRRLAEMTAQNASRLMAEMPELANQLLAGRELPQGAVVIGGNPNVDLLQQMAAKMTMGGYSDGQQAMGAESPSMMMGGHVRSRTMSNATPIPQSMSSDRGGWLYLPFPAAADYLTGQGGLAAGDFTNATNSYYKIPFLNSKSVIIDEVLVNIGQTLPGTAQTMALVWNGTYVNNIGVQVAKSFPSGAAAAPNLATELFDLNTLTVGITANLPIHPTNGTGRNDNVIPAFAELYLYFPLAPTTFKGLQVAIRYREQR